MPFVVWIVGSGHPAAISDLATVTFAPVSTIARHGMSLAQPWVTRIGSAFSVMTVNALWGALMYAPAFPLLRRPSLFSRQLAKHSVLFFFVSWSPFRSSWRFPHVSVWPLIVFQAPVIISLPTVRSSIPEVARFSTPPATGLSCVPSLGGGRLVLPVRFSVIYVWSGGYQYSLQV
jgi:hypothetical protein